MFGYGKVPDFYGGSGRTWRVRVSEVREVLEASSPTAVAEEVLSIQLFGVGLGGRETSLQELSSGNQVPAEFQEGSGYMNCVGGIRLREGRRCLVSVSLAQKM